MQRVLTYLFFILITISSSFAQQNEVLRGVPFIQNFQTENFAAHEQNYAAVQDDNGFMFFANFAGILEYDGTNWRSFPTKSGMRVTALAKNNFGTIYAGGLYDFGYIEQDNKGVASFVTLTDLLTLKSEEVGNVHTITVVNEKVYFISEKKIFLYENGKVTVVNLKNNVLSAFSFNGKLFLFFSRTNKIAPENQKGLVSFSNNKFTTVETDIIELSGATNLSSTKLLLASSNQGLYTLEGGVVLEFNSDVSKLTKQMVVSGVVANEHTFVVSTKSNGVLVCEHDGTLIQNINKQKGIADNTVNDGYLDKDGSLWLMTNSGITLTNLSTPLSLLSSKNSQLKGKINKVIKFQEQLYFATSQGLFSYKGNKFAKSPYLKTACIDIYSNNELLLGASSKGIYNISAGGKRISSKFTFSISGSSTQGNILYTGHTGLISIYKQIGKNVNLVDSIDGIVGDVTNIIEDKEGNIFCEASPGKIYLKEKGDAPVLEISKNTNFISLHLNSKNGIVFFTSEKGISHYDFETRTISPFALLKDVNENKKLWIHDYFESLNDDNYITDGNKKNIQICNNSLNQSPFLPITDFHVNDVFLDQNTLIIAGKKGLIIYDKDSKFDVLKNFPTYLKQVVLTQTDSTLAKADSISLAFNENSLRFNFTAPTYFSGKETQYRYFLKNFDKDSSSWTTRSYKEYTNLPSGKYTFIVQAKNAYGVISEGAECFIFIETPIYLRWYAYIFYAIILLGLVKLVIDRRMKAAQKERDALENIVKERTEEVENQKEELQSQAEELEHKNQELEKIDTIVQAVNQEIEFSALLNTFLQKIQSMTGADIAVALIFNDTEKRFSYKAAIGIDINEISGVSLKFKEAERRYIASSSEIYEDVFYTANIDKDSQREYEGDLPLPKSRLVSAVNIGDKTQGFLILMNMTQTDGFSSEHFSLAANLKEHIKSAFSKAKVLENLQDTLGNLKDTQEELIRQEKLASVGQLTQGIVDRIINPLNYITNYSTITGELLEEVSEVLEEAEITGDAKEELDEISLMAKSNLQKIADHGNSTVRIIKSMEKLLKEKSMNFTMENISKTLSSTVEVAVKEFKTENVGAKVPDVILEGDVELEAEMLGYEMQQAFHALIDNACDACLDSDSPKVLVSWELTEKNIQIKIRDNGTGIPQKEIDKIFQPFFTTKPTSKGTGLGLYMVKEIVELHKGTFEVQSEYQKFTEFTVTIPQKV